eukprot:1441327-Rhodomonas_salina.1
MSAVESAEIDTDSIEAVSFCWAHAQMLFEVRGGWESGSCTKREGGREKRRCRDKKAQEADVE